jgi:predicted Fe-Mo cluster-binding NifX family protein
MKKIATPSDDGVNIAGHFGRCGKFIVFTTDADSIVETEFRENGVTAHALGECSGEGHEHGHDHEHGHNHEGVVGLLSDCEVVLCLGMGWRAAEALKQGGIEPFVTDGSLTARESVDAYLKGTLPTSSTSFCRCHG